MSEALFGTFAYFCLRVGKLCHLTKGCIAKILTKGTLSCVIPFGGGGGGKDIKKC